MNSIVFIFEQSVCITKSTRVLRLKIKLYSIGVVGAGGLVLSELVMVAHSTTTDDTT